MRTLFFFDEQSVKSAQGVTFHLSRAEKHPRNPVLIPGETAEWDSLQIAWPGTVLFDEEESIFRCWYHGLDVVQKDRPADRPVPWMPGYAESPDGVHWTKPKLGFHTHRDNPTNRLGADWEAWAFSFVFPNPDKSDSQRRYLSFWKDWRSFNEPQSPRLLASSADGKLWHYEKLVYQETAPRHQMQDFCQVLHQPDAADPEYSYIAYSQYWEKREWDGLLVRQIGLHHGRSIETLQDARKPVVLGPIQGIDEQNHFASVYRTGGNYLMLFESHRYSCNPLDGDLRLAVSDDGQNFRRVHQHSAVVDTGENGSWDENMLVTTTTSMQEVGDEIWIYYFGCPNVWRNWPNGGAYRGSLYYPTYLGLAILPRDRFAYGTGPGVIETNPLPKDGELWVNADGALEIEVVGCEGTTLSNGRLSDIYRQSVYRRVQWDRPIPRGNFTLRIHLAEDTSLYSLQSDAFPSALNGH